ALSLLDALPIYGDRLLGVLGAVPAFADVLDLLLHVLARLGAGGFALALVARRGLACLLLRHGASPLDGRGRCSSEKVKRPCTSPLTRGRRTSPTPPAPAGTAGRCPARCRRRAHRVRAGR